jgi:hypothetical protein
MSDPEQSDQLRMGTGMSEDTAPGTRLVVAAWCAPLGFRRCGRLVGREFDLRCGGGRGPSGDMWKQGSPSPHIRRGGRQPPTDLDTGGACRSRGSEGVSDPSTTTDDPPLMTIGDLAALLAVPDPESEARGGQRHGGATPRRVLVTGARCVVMTTHPRLCESICGVLTARAVDCRR